MNFELQNVVLEDLLHIHGTWLGRIEDASLRRESTILRRLLHEDDLGKAWRDAGLLKEPEIAAPYIEGTIERYGLSRIPFLSAGGGSHGGVRVQHAFFVEGVTPEDDPHLLGTAGGEWPLRKFRLSRYMNSASMAVRGHAVSRRQLIAYVANKTGGSHLDQKRPAELVLERVLDQVRGQEAAALTGQTTAVEVADKDSVLFELLSIGYCVTRSPDVERLMAALAANLGRGRDPVGDRPS